MAVRGGEDVYATLLLTDSYLPGALVLAHSLRDAGTTKKLAVLVTLDTVSAEVVTQLKAVYDYIIPVGRIQNQQPANLYLMDRPDLHSAFTKITLWKQAQFRKIVYIDSDIVAYRAPDELFDLPNAFSAAPDIGWPDLFNTGVMVLTPNMGDYYALMAMAERGISFDGADQGLLNLHFGNSYNRLSFSYNVTPSAHYQYIPAYRHFQSTISMVHFIGPDKPWTQGRDAHTGGSPFDGMVGRWWAVYDRHYRREPPTSTTQTTTTQATQPPPELVQYFVKGEYQPQVSYVLPVGEPSREQTVPSHGYQELRQHEATPQHHAPGHHHHEQPRLGSSGQQFEEQRSLPSEFSQSSAGLQPEARKDQVSGHQEGAPHPPQSHVPHHQPQPVQSWDAQRHPPPQDSKPEAFNFPQTHYEMSSDPAPFVPPERYPSPPRDMWYDVPKEPPAPTSQKPRAIFPWETHQPRASRVFPKDLTPPEPMTTEQPTTELPGERKASTDHQALTEPSFTESSSAGPASASEGAPEHATTTTLAVAPSNPWSSFPRTNAWDELPEIERYVGALEKHRRTRSRGLRVGGFTPPNFVQEEGQRRGSRVTDFPSEADRPSLPVTPAPIRRPRLWGAGADPNTGQPGDDDEEEFLPAAAGVPAQTDWDPMAQLQKLAQEQSELLQRKLGVGSGSTTTDDGDSSVPGTESREIPARPLPFGSEGVRSPTYAAQSSTVLSPQPVKPGSQTSSVRNMLPGEPEAIPREVSQASMSMVAEPSYRGPGAAFEKGEDMPTSETPAGPTEEERDVLDT